MKQNDHTDYKISQDESENNRESTLSSEIKEDNLNHQQEVQLWGQASRDDSLQPTGVPLPKQQSRADNVIAHPPVPNSRKPPRSMALQQLQCQKSALLDRLSQSDSAPYAQALAPPKSSGDKNAPQPKASADQNVPQHQMATFEVVKRFMEAIVFTNTPWPILSDDKYWMVEEFWRVAIHAQDHQWAVAGAPVGIPSVCQLPGGPSPKMDLQTWTALSLRFFLMLLYQIYTIEDAPKQT